MSSLVRRMQRRMAAKVNDADPERKPYRICKRVKGLTSRQAQRGIRRFIGRKIEDLREG